MQLRVRTFNVCQRILQIKEMIFDYLIVIVTQKSVETCPHEINVKMTFLRLVTRYFLGISLDENFHIFRLELCLNPPVTNRRLITLLRGSSPLI